MAEEKIEERRKPGRPSNEEIRRRQAAAQAQGQDKRADVDQELEADVVDCIPLIKYLCKKCKRTRDVRSHQVEPFICAWCRQPMKYVVELPTE